jgi:hypothetical protein
LIIYKKNDSASNIGENQFKVIGIDGALISFDILRNNTSEKDSGIVGN